ncbi:MAG: pyridoxamine 5'-phosphate oxidase family protein [Nocardioides sp.]|uniref:pyridoxamine 5'-phosphate oxidase family protein n=1 Tax=Nocardioides sp. TaxID=35761 RepID=UPI003F0EE9A0
MQSTATRPAERPSLEPTPRSTVVRGRHRALTDRGALHEVLRAGLIAHLGVVAGDHPVVLPVAYAVDVNGPDRDGTLYLHGSVASRWLTAGLGRTVCVTVTEVDGLVLAHTAFDHSMNYRSAVVIGEAREVTDPDEKVRALDLIVDHSVPGRAASLRPHTRKELVATTVLAVALHEASVKVRSGGPGGEADDQDAVWAGHVPLERVARAPVTADGIHVPVPDIVADRAVDLGWRPSRGTS